MSQEPATSKPQPPVAPMQQGSLADQLPKAHEYTGQPAAPRERFRFVFPEGVRKTKPPHKDPKVVVMQELLESEIDMAEKIAPDSPRKHIFECVKLSLVQVGYQYDPRGATAAAQCPDLRVVNHAEAEADILWAQWGMKVKYQLVEAWKRINQTTKVEDADFLESMTPV